MCIKNLYYDLNDERVKCLTQTDERLGRLIRHICSCELQIEEDGFKCLMKYIIGQQISDKARQTLWQRMCNKYDNLTPDKVLCLSNSDFILLEGQTLVNERDAWRHKYDHMNKFIKADAIVVCNPGGIIGQGTMFEFGFMTAHAKRIIFTEEPKGLSILFPCEIGLNFG